MATSIHQITKAEFAEMDDPPGGRLQLHHGEVVKVTFPKGPNTLAQNNLVDELKPRARGQGKVIMELPYCPLPEYEVWAADVAFVSRSQWAAWDKRDWLPGAPTLVIEVLSPSNTKAEIADKRQTCFAGGCQEFWLVDPKKKTVQTWTPNGGTCKYSEADSVPLTIMGAAALPVSTIFQED
jgi:Uma2 family endonuclease